MRFLSVALAVMGCLAVGCGTDNRTNGAADMGLQIDLGERTDMASTGDMGSSTTDMGTSGDMGSSSCGEVPAPEAPSMGVQCTAETLTCVMGCTTAECQQACVEMDDFTGDGTPDTACLACVNGYAVACGYSQGCNDEYDTASCCVLEHCASTPTQECIAMNCASQQNAFIACVNSALGARPACAQDALGCFPSS